jgi:flagellar hook-length control protein FliK
VAEASSELSYAEFAVSSLNRVQNPVPAAGPVTEASSELSYAEFSVSSLNPVQNPVLAAGPVTEASSELSYAEFAVSSLNRVQNPVLAAGLDASKAVNPSATLVAGNVGLVAPKLSSGLSSVKAKLAKDKISDDAPKGNEGITTGGGVVRPDEGSFRARISQEIKLLTQQASLSCQAVDPQQHVVIELELPKYGKAASEVNLATLEARGETSVQSAELSTSANDTSASQPLDGFLATATDLENSGAYWISGDLKNAKMTLGDAVEGVVEVSISLQGNQAQVAFKADETMTRNALQDSGSELKEMLRRDGIELSGVSVGTSGAGDGGGDRERSRSESRRATPLQVVAPSLESPASAGLSGSAQRLDLYV